MEVLRMIIEIEPAGGSAASGKTRKVKLNDMKLSLISCIK